MSEGRPLIVPSELARLLETAVENGEYSTSEAALADAIALWQERHENAAETLAWMRARIRRARLDPTPHLSESEVDQRMALFFSSFDKSADEAA